MTTTIVPDQQAGAAPRAWTPKTSTGPSAPMSLLMIAALLTGGALAALGAWSAVPLIAVRAAAREVDIDLASEQHLLASVWADARRLPFLLELSPSDFAVGTHQRLWQAFVDAAQHFGIDRIRITSTTYAQAAGATLTNLQAEWDSAVLERLSRPDMDALLHLPPTTEDGTPLTQESLDPSVEQAGAAVLAAANDRTVFNGAALIVPSSTPDSTDPAHPPLVRVPAHVSTSRRAVCAALAVAWLSSSVPLLHLTGFTGAAAVLAFLSWLALGAGMLVVALVDHDTMYIDMPAWVVTMVASWALATAAAAVDQDLTRLIVGVIMVAAIAFIFELVNFLYKRVRGRNGQGFGDTLIIMATVGIPVALTGEWILAYYSVMGAYVASILAWIVFRALGRAGRHIPFAFGPWLALGPMLAVAVPTFITL